MSPVPSLEDARRRHLAGRLDDARSVYDAILEIEPSNHAALHLRGMLALQQGEGTLAEQLLRQALVLDAENGAYFNGLGQILFFKGDFDGAAVAWEAALGLDPQDGSAAYNYGTLCLQQGQHNGAVKWLRSAIDAGEAKNWEAHANLANALARLRRFEEAEVAYRTARALSPENTPLMVSHADVLTRTGAPDKAEALLKDSLRTAPEFAPAYINLSNACLAQARVPDALEALDRALDLDPSLDDIHHKRLFFSHYLENLGSEDLARQHCEWGADFAQDIQAMPPPAVCGEGPLRVGYVSADLGWHSVGLFMAPVIAAHDRVRYHVTCYSGLELEDTLTEIIKNNADRWRASAHMSDAALAETIRADGIQVLVDLSGHTGGQRLGVFARRPSPVQISYLGYPGSAGLAAIGYRIADNWTEPEITTGAVSDEKILRLEDGFHCFCGPGLDPGEGQPVMPPPAANPCRGITFASFNNIAKVNDGVIELWARLLRVVPEAELFLKDQRFKNGAVRRQFENAFADYGIEKTRLRLEGAQGARCDHLARYAEVDIALDPFPYNGTTTTCEALWMGVPVITLAGNRSDARVGLSLLGQMRLEEFVAKSQDDFITIAAGLAADRGRLILLRSQLRGRLESSSLGQARDLTAKLETAYLAAWSETTEVWNKD